MGRIIGDYIIEDKIGEGSIGAVYLAHQASLDRKVALKILSAKYTNQKGMSAFLTEARAAAKLSHTNLVQCVGVGEENGACYMAMTYIKGMALKDKIKSEGKIGVDEALHITQQVAEALYFAWEEAKLIHRDVKPENIMIDENGIVKLTDLGLAMQQKDWHANMEISGSPSYMSPEQFTGERLDSRSDIYSLGITLYQMLSGKLPFRGKTLNTVAKQHFTEKSVSLNKIEPLIPKPVSDLVSRMLEKKMADRFANMDELLKEIWKIRQNTAPEKEFVPDVHTVTMKKLDYDLQEQSKRKKIQLQIVEAKEKKKSEVYVKIIAFAIPIVILVTLIAIASGSQKKKNLEIRQKLLASLEKMFDNEDISVMAVSDETAKVQKFFADNSSAGNEDQTLSLRLSLCAEKLDRLKVTERNKVLETQTSSLALRLHDLEERVKDSTILDASIKQKDSAIRDLESKVSLAEKDLEKERKTAKELRDKLSVMRAREFEEWRDDIRVKTYLLIRNGKFAEAFGLLKVSSEDETDRRTKWIETKKQEIGAIERLFLEIDKLGGKLSGLEIEEGKLNEISGGKALVTSKSGAAESLPWKNLSAASFKTLIQNLSELENREKLPYYFAMLNGRFCDASELLKNDDEIRGTVLAVRTYQLENIKYIAESDKKKAFLKADMLYKDFAGTENMDTIKKETDELLLVEGAITPP
jgi:serine/threonine protein kinase